MNEQDREVLEAAHDFQVTADELILDRLAQLRKAGQYEAAEALLAEYDKRPSLAFRIKQIPDLGTTE